MPLAVDTDLQRQNEQATVEIFQMRHRLTWNLSMYSVIADTLVIEMVKYNFEF